MTIELGRERGASSAGVIEVADRIADELHQASHGQPKYAKVTSLLQAFRTTEGPTRIGEVVRVLRERGIVVDSGWTTEDGNPSIRRPGLLRLAPSGQVASKTATFGGDPSIRTRIFGHGYVVNRPSMLQEREGLTAGDVLWFDIDPPTSDLGGGSEDLTRRALVERATHVAERLRHWCPGLDEEMLHDLLRQDIQPKVETYTDERDCLRGVSVVAVIAQEMPGDIDDFDKVSERLIFDMVEIVVGDGWMVTCWHPGRVVAGASSASDEISLLKEPFVRSMETQWLSETGTSRTGETKTSGDLGIYLARALTDTYSASHRMIEQWIANWEADFYSALTQKDKSERLRKAAAEISNLLSMVGEFRRRAKAFSHARYATPDRTWFPELSDRDPKVDEAEDQSEQARALAETVRAAEEKCEVLSTDVRGYMDLLMLQSSAAQQESTERLQSYLGKVTGLVLVPTLIAGLFGANTQLPGRDSWMGFDTMLILMVVSAVAVYFVMRRVID